MTDKVPCEVCGFKKSWNYTGCPDCECRDRLFGYAAKAVLSSSVTVDGRELTDLEKAQALTSGKDR